MIILKQLVRFLLNAYVRYQSKECGTLLRVNHWTDIGENTYLGNNVNFNGLKIKGGVLSELGIIFIRGWGAL